MRVSQLVHRIGRQSLVTGVFGDNNVTPVCDHENYNDTVASAAVLFHSVVCLLLIIDKLTIPELFGNWQATTMFFRFSF